MMLIGIIGGGASGMAAALAAAETLKDKALTIHAKAGNGGRLFGSVTTKEVADALEKQVGVKVDKRKITMNDIKAFGTYTAEVKLYTGVTAEIQVVVAE